MGRKETIISWFSCGAASAVAAKRTIEIYGKSHHVLVVNTPIKEEHEDNRRFLKDVESWIEQPILSAVNSKFPESSIVEVFEKRKYMSGVLGAPCTGILKKDARYEFENFLEPDKMVLGFTIDEWKRQKRFNKSEKANALPVLISDLTTKEDCFRILHKNGIELPEMYSLGYPNANCIGCVKSSSPTYWNLVRQTHPEVFRERAEQSRRLGVKLVKVKGKRKFLDELKPTDKGGVIKNWDCGIFCGTEID